MSSDRRKYVKERLIGRVIVTLIYFVNGKGWWSWAFAPRSIDGMIIASVIFVMYTDDCPTVAERSRGSLMGGFMIL